MFHLQDHQIQSAQIINQALELGKRIRFENDGFESYVYSPDDAMTTIIKIDSIIFKPTLH
jgi:hypothetical protein